MLQFKDMSVSEIINHFARSDDPNERDLADMLQAQADQLKDARDRVEELESGLTNCDCGDGVCECGEECEDHHCSTCTCFQ